MSPVAPSSDPSSPPPAASTPITALTTIGYLGPQGTFTEQVLLTQADLAGAERRPIGSIPDSMHALVTGEVDLALVPIENGIEGAVNVTLDTITFDIDVLIQRELILDIQFNLLALPRTRLEDIHTVLSYPVALAQCRAFLREQLPNAIVDIATSTADAARRIGEEQLAGVAAISNPLAADLYGLEAVVEAVEDHAGNQTRFLLLAREGIAPPSGHDKTSVVVFQRANQPGSLVSILQEFSARGINLSRLESRPTRQGLGDYCFALDMEGHVENEIIGDCLRELKMTQGDVKFLGSYPAAGANGEGMRRESNAEWVEARDWLDDLRSRIRR